MAIILTIIIAVVAVFAYEFDMPFRDFANWVEGILFGLALGLAAFLITGIISLGICIGYQNGDNILATDYHPGEVVEYDLVTLKDNFGVSGSYYLFSSYIDSDLYYVYMTKEEGTGRIRTEKLKVDSDTTFLIPTSNSAAILKKTTYYCHNSWMKFWTTGLCNTRTIYDFYIPEDGVFQGYEVDLE